MNHFSSLAAVAATLLAAASCTNKDELIIRGQCAPVTVAVNTFSLTLPYGSYKMCVIAHEGDCHMEF